MCLMTFLSLQTNSGISYINGLANTAASRCKTPLLPQKPEVEIFWREIEKLVMDLFEFYFP